MTTCKMILDYTKCEIICMRGSLLQNLYNNQSHNQSSQALTRLMYIKSQANSTQNSILKLNCLGCRTSYNQIKDLCFRSKCYVRMFDKHNYIAAALYPWEESTYGLSLVYPHGFLQPVMLKCYMLKICCYFCV